MVERVNANLVGTNEAAVLFGVRADGLGPGGRQGRTGPRRAVALADLPLSPDAARWLPLIKRRIVRGFRPDRIVLFGSQARGEARADSDLDLLVVIPGIAHRRHAEAAIYAALAGIPLATDVVVTTPDDVDRYQDVVGSVLLPALREGVTIYARA